jgi:hypothetical protein
MSLILQTGCHRQYMHGLKKDNVRIKFAEFVWCGLIAGKYLASP